MSERTRNTTPTPIKEMFDDDVAFDEFFTDSVNSREEILQSSEIAPNQRPQGELLPQESAPKKEKPTHYKVISISLYNEDIERLKMLVSAAKKKGLTRMSRSQLIREALRQIDLDKIPPQR